MSAALDGYRVLVVDLDSQGSMTSLFGGRVADEWDTVFPLIARDYALGLQAENRRRAERGEAPLPLEETLDAALGKTAADVIQRTHWPNIDLIGAQLNLYWAEFQIPVWRMSLRGWKLWEALGNALARDGVLEAYDLVILDTPPALGYLTINGLTAADILLVPLGASFLEFDSTGRFFDMLHSTFASIEDGENMAARALGRPEIRFEWDAVRAVITRYDAGQQAELAGLMQAYLGRTLSPLAPGLHRAGRPGRRAGRRHLRGRLPRLQPRHLRPRPRHLRRDLRRLQAAAARRLAPRRAGRGRPREGARLMARRRLAPADPAGRGCSARGTSPARPWPGSAPPRRSPGSPPRPPAPPRWRSSTESVARARETGRMVLDLPLDAIAPDHLTRDRLPAEDAEMAALARLDPRPRPAHADRGDAASTARAPCPTA